MMLVQHSSGLHRPFPLRLTERKLLLSLDRDVFSEIEFCGFVMKRMTVGHVARFLGRVNPAEPTRKAAQSLMIHAGYVLVQFLPGGGRRNLNIQGNLSAEVTKKNFYPHLL